MADVAIEGGGKGDFTKSLELFPLPMPAAGLFSIMMRARIGKAQAQAHWRWSEGAGKEVRSRVGLLWVVIDGRGPGKGGGREWTGWILGVGRLQRSAGGHQRSGTSQFQI